MDMFLLACSAAARCCSCSAAQRSGNRMGASAAVALLTAQQPPLPGSISGGRQHSPRRSLLLLCGIGCFLQPLQLCQSHTRART